MVLKLCLNHLFFSEDYRHQSSFPGTLRFAHTCLSLILRNLNDTQGICKNSFKTIFHFTITLGRPGFKISTIVSITWNLPTFNLGVKHGRGWDPQEPPGTGLMTRQKKSVFLCRKPFLTRGKKGGLEPFEPELQQFDIILPDFSHPLFRDVIPFQKRRFKHEFPEFIDVVTDHEKYLFAFFRQLHAGG